MKLRYVGATHVGMKRTHNEDHFALVPAQGLYVVADGMGGHACGEVASQLSVETLDDFFNRIAEDEAMTWPCREQKSLSEQQNRLVASVKLANRRIFEKSQAEASHKGMGTTIVALLFHDQDASIAHVGDSRIYRLRDDELSQLTEDHSLLNDYKKMVTLTEEEERNFPHKNIIVRALGMKEVVQVDVTTLNIAPGDLYLLCSDGLNGELEDEQMFEILAAHPDDLEGACSQLIQAACDHGGKDNVTVIIVQVVE